MYKRAREEFVPYQEFLRRTRPRIDRRTVSVYRGGVSKRRYDPNAVRPRAVLRTGGLQLHATNVEKKFVDTATTTDVTTTAFIGAMNIMAQGTSASTRIGQRILCKSIELRGIFERENPATTTTEDFRIMVLYDRQANGALPAATDILVTAAPTAFRNMGSTERFYCLLDEHIDISTPEGGRATLPYHKFIKINLPTVFNASNAGTIADITSGSLILFYVGNNAAGADDINCLMNMRVRYTDM